MAILIRWTAIGVIVLALVLWLSKSWRPEPKKITDAVGVSDPTATSAKEDLSAIQMRRVAASASLRRYLAQAVEAREMIEAAQAENGRWKNEVEVLLTNQEGQLLSGNVAYVVSFHEDWMLDKPSLEVVGKTRAAIEELVRAAKDGISSGQLSGPTPEMDSQLRKLLEDARKYEAAYREPRERITSLLVEARVRQIGGSVTLKQAIEQGKRDEAIQVATVRKEQRQVEAGRYLGAERERIATSEHARREALLEHERCTQAGRKDLQEVFSPFLAEGHRNAYGDNCFVCQLSYGQLQKKGVLDSPESFLEFAKNSGQHGRPTWGESERALAVQRLATFKFLAPAWVRLGLLRP